MGSFPPDHDPGVELRDHLPAEGWRAAMRAILARHALPASELAPFASGSDVVWGTPAHVVKLTAPCWADEIDAEARGLARVAGRLSVRTPEVVAGGELAGWPYVVTTRVAGSALGDAWPRLAREERLDLAAALGRLIAELRAVPVDDVPDDWPEFRRAHLGEPARRHARGGVDESLLEPIDAFLARFPDLDDEPRAFLHTELLGEHVLVAPVDGRLELAALLDLADSRVGPAGYELPAPVEFLFRGEPGLLRALLLESGTALGDDDELASQRTLAWGLTHRFGSLARMLAAVAPDRPRTLEVLARNLYAL